MQRTYSVAPPAVPMVEAAWVLAVGIALRPVLEALETGSALPWPGHVAAGTIPVAIWLLTARAALPVRPGRTKTAGLLRALLAPALATALAPAFQVVFLPQRPTVPLPLLLMSVPAVLVVPLLLRAALSRTATDSVSCASRAIGWLIAAEIVAVVVQLGFPPTAVLKEDWLDLARTAARDALRIGCVILLSSYLVLGHRRLAGFALGARRFALRLSPRVFVGLAAAASVLSCSLFAGLVLDRMPHIQDETAVHFQAKVFASGHLYAQAPALPEFFDQEFLVFDGGRWYGKYQPGPSVLLAIGVPFGLEWLANPLLSGVGVGLLYLLARRLAPPAAARLIVLLAIISPFWILTFSSMMAHAGCLVILMGGAYVLVRAAAAPSPAGWALAAGLLLGGALLFRPYTAVVLSGSILLVVLIARRRSMLRPSLLAPLAAGGAIMVALALAYNYALTRDPWTLPFERFSATDRLGFGPDRGLEYWLSADRGHTPARALRNLRINLDLLARTLLGWPTAALLLAAVPLAWHRHRRLALALCPAALGLPIAYGFYLFHGVGFGPRYWSEAMPAWLLLIAVGLLVACHWWRRVLSVVGGPRAAGRSRAAVLVAGCLLTAGALTGFWPKTLEVYGHNLWQIGRDIQDAVARAGLANAVVFVDAPAYHATRSWLDNFGAGFAFNWPTLDGSVVYARDLGPERNVKLMARYPGRRFYAIAPGALAADSLTEITPPESLRLTRRAPPSRGGNEEQ